MFDSPIVEVVIGLTFVFLVLSLCATALVDGIVEWRQWRGRLLHSKLRTLLGKRLVDLFYQDRRIRDLASGRASSKASWLKARVDRIWGLGFLQRKWLDWGKFTSTSRYEAHVIARSMNAGRLPSQIPDNVFADVILDWLQGIELPWQLQPDYAAPDVIPDELAVMWQGMSVRAGGSQDSLRAELQQWYSQSMERTSGEFKRRIRLALYAVGIALVVATNANTIKITSTLYRDPLLRAQSVALASRTVDSCPAGPQDCPALKAYRDDVLSKSGATGPLGWDEGELAKLWGSWSLLWAMFGWMLTVLAIGLGADFWFGALKKMLTLRAGSVESNRAELDARANPPRAETLAPRSVVAHEPLDLEAPSMARLRGFQPLRYAESNVHAFWLAHLASLAYSDAATLRGSSLLQHHRLVMHPLDAGGTQGFVFTGPDACIVAFRGTETKLEDWLTDADARQQQKPWGKDDESIGIHSGFHAALDHVWADLLNQVTQAALPVWFTGHSLGGALAVLAAYRLEAIETPGLQVAGVYTFGQPRIGNVAWAKSVPLQLEQRIFRYINDRDIVPLVPPSLPSPPFDYHHIGHPRYFDASGRLHQNRTLWERIAEQLSPAMALVAVGGEGWEALARDHARERVADHGMARYIECLERLDAVRALLKPA